MPNPRPDFSPACPIPYVVQTSERVEQLKTFLKTEFGQVQRINIEALIRLYEDGKLEPRQDGEAPLYLVDGQVVDKDPWEDPSIPKKAKRWCESMAESFPYSDVVRMHQLHALIKIPEEYGGEGEPTRQLLVCNNTGSSVLTLFYSDLVALEFDVSLHYGALRSAGSILTANGHVILPTIAVDIQILTSTFVPLTPWLRETAVVKADTPGEFRLSGAAMRNHLLFATPPGNANLYVAQKKVGIYSELAC
ncbi:hypothetical protein PENNAL_c0004G06162 [Penicillium nalgiovense]|uniref:Uncharacterized protein n=1 Tax=Penicillium nalgiovense TaxID=60175 RepID=A0A1V6Z3B4_PENNA|nr:hypothetical protein PENNAL_c0004G06162 [Penicillium nalgiovense]